MGRKGRRDVEEHEEGLESEDVKSIELGNSSKFWLFSFCSLDDRTFGVPWTFNAIYIYIYHKRFFFRCVGNEFTSNKKPVAKEPSKSPSPAWRNWRWRTQDIYLSVGSYNRFFVINGVMLKNMQEKTTQFNHRHFQGGLSSFLLSCFVFCTSFIPMFLKSQQENTHKCQQV